MPDRIYTPSVIDEICDYALKVAPEIPWLVEPLTPGRGRAFLLQHILRNRLFDIDIIINRTLVYVPLTGILTGLYAASIALFQRVFIAVTGPRPRRMLASQQPHRYGLARGLSRTDGRETGAQCSPRYSAWRVFLHLVQ